LSTEAESKAEAAMDPVREALVCAGGDSRKRNRLHRTWNGSLVVSFFDRSPDLLSCRCKTREYNNETHGPSRKVSGNLVHDFLGAYFEFKLCCHFLCNAHWQGKLAHLHEQMDKPLAGKIIEALLEPRQ